MRLYLNGLWRNDVWKEILRVIHRHLRRKWYKTFNPEHIKQGIARRKGKCKMCGCCRERLFKCKYLHGKMCLLWKNQGWDAMPEDCRNYPFDEKDKNNYPGFDCGFYWRSENRQV